ncbi:DNA polymerase III subunit delta' [Macrococcus sp. DPC7161]|uniref:DNA polymerase III subunit delta' n=1 Tax=Macrococcus sp. DPC7161 TaxID=2507060 RepID=UPI0013E98907|nr:DNA polymerase III subunit delta' [Macrococcus sp. DPC7161]
MLNQLQTIIEQNKINHAYLFEGDRLSDLNEQAVLFAQAILCSDDICKLKVEQGNHADFLFIDSKEQTIKKEAIEHVLHRMNQKPIEGTYKVYVISEFDKVTTQGENSILKFLEEPPENTIAILTSTHSNHILPTIHSRCQHIHIPSAEMDLVEIPGIQPATLQTMQQLKLSQKDAEYWIEQSFNEIRSAVINWCKSLLNDGTMSLIKIVDIVSLLDSREKQLMFIDMMQLYFQDLLYKKMNVAPVSYREVEGVQVDMLSIDNLVVYIDATLNAKEKLMQYVNITLVLEQLGIRIYMR